jgi:hypothetical protein
MCHFCSPCWLVLLEAAGPTPCPPTPAPASAQGGPPPRAGGARRSSAALRSGLRSRANGGQGQAAAERRRARRGDHFPRWERRVPRRRRDYAAGPRCPGQTRASAAPWPLLPANAVHLLARPARPRARAGGALPGAGGRASRSAASAQRRSGPPRARSALLGERRSGARSGGGGGAARKSARLAAPRGAPWPRPERPLEAERWKRLRNLFSAATRAVHDTNRGRSACADRASWDPGFSR